MQFIPRDSEVAPEVGSRFRRVIRSRAAGAVIGVALGTGLALMTYGARRIGMDGNFEDSVATGSLKAGSALTSLSSAAAGSRILATPDQWPLRR